MPIQKSLLEEIASEDFLHNTWRALNRINKSSRGLSNISIKDFAENLEKNISDISSSLVAGNYRFSDVKAVTINKSDGGLRPLRIAEIKDRIVQKALSIKLDKLLTPIYDLDNKCSFAYRKNRNVEGAIEQMQEYFNQGYNIILEADIEKFFDTVDKKSLLEEIESHLPDVSINELLKASTSQKVGNVNGIDEKIYEKYFADTEDGIPQGNALSPLLANVYLSSFDKMIIERDLKMIRYADDFIIMCKDEKSAMEAFEIAKHELEHNKKLKLHDLGDPNDKDAKSKIVNPAYNKFSFLSIRFDGKRLWVKEKKVDAFIEKITSASDIKSLKENKKPIQLLLIMTSVKNIIEGWIAAYWFVDLTNEIREIDKRINRNLYLVFTDLGFKLDKSSLERIAFKGTNRKVWMLNNTQRVNTGIPFCNFIWNRIKTRKKALKNKKA